MTTVYERLGLTIDASFFGAAANLSSGAANSLAFIADNTPPLPDWQISALSNGATTPIVRTDYFQNPLSSNLSSIYTSAHTIYITATTAADTDVALSANNLMIKVDQFTKHTDNIAGVSVVMDANTPSYDTASALGQQVMMILAKTDGNTSVTNTTPILGSFSSLFIPKDIQTNTIQMVAYAGEYANSLISDGMGGYYSGLGPEENANIISYMNSTSALMNLRWSSDVTYYNNAKKVVQDYSFLQQFNNMGGTNTYLVTNIVGTPTLANNITANS
jgi:hypothetical protein